MNGSEELQETRNSELDANMENSATAYFAAAPRTFQQRILFGILTSSAFEAIVACVVVIQFVLMIIDADASTTAEGPPEWLKTTNFCILLAYVVEAVIRMYVFRMEFWFNGWNLLDLLIILSDSTMLIVDSAMGQQAPGLGFLRIFRLMRLARSVKVMLLFPQLALMVKGLLRSTVIVFWGFVMLAISMIVFGILAVQVIHPINERVALSGAYHNCDRCAKAYSTVGAAALTFASQIIAGDSWGSTSLPIIEEAPESALFFVVTFAVIHLMILNVILSVVVETSAKCASEDYKWVAKEHEREFAKASAKLMIICKELDSDGSGYLTKAELLGGFDNNEGFRQLMQVMQIEREDCEAVFNMIDLDGSGDIQYNEFITELHKMKSHDSHTMLVFLKYYVLEISRVTQRIASSVGASTSSREPAADQNRQPQASVPDSELGKKELYSRSPEADRMLSQGLMDLQQTLREELCLSVQHLKAHAERQSRAMDEMRLAFKDPSVRERFLAGSAFLPTPVLSAEDLRRADPRGAFGPPPSEGNSGGGGAVASSARRPKNVPGPYCCQFEEGKRDSIKASDASAYTRSDGTGRGRDVQALPAGGIGYARPTPATPAPPPGPQ